MFWEAVYSSISGPHTGFGYTGKKVFKEGDAEKHIIGAIKLGMDINAPDSEGITALSYAEIAKNMNMVKFLKKLGAR